MGLNVEELDSRTFCIVGDTVLVLNHYRSQATLEVIDVVSVSPCLRFG